MNAEFYGKNLTKILAFPISLYICNDTYGELWSKEIIAQ